MGRQQETTPGLEHRVQTCLSPEQSLAMLRSPVHQLLALHRRRSRRSYCHLNTIGGDRICCMLLYTRANLISNIRKINHMTICLMTPQIDCWEQCWMKGNFGSKLGTRIRVKGGKREDLFIKHDITGYVNSPGRRINTFVAFVKSIVA
jgi:hypothetical protein